MLIRFSVENYRSFSERQELSFVKGRPRTLAEHIIPAIKSGQSDLLRVGLLYGANASGKSNFVKAIAAAQGLIVRGTKAGSKLPARPFRLDTKWESKPSAFEFEIRANGRDYSYGIAITSSVVVREWLYEVGQSKDTKLFEFIRDDGGKPQLRDVSGIACRDAKARSFLDFLAAGTRSNALFLTECHERNALETLGDSVKNVLTVWAWFAEHLRVIFPTSEYEFWDAEFEGDTKFREEFSRLISAFDTGIESIASEDIDLKLLDMPNELREELEKNKFSRAVVRGPHSERYWLSCADKGPLKARKLTTQHKRADGTGLVKFELHDESDGTRRLIDLIPALMELRNQDTVFVIDELNRSLHPHLTSAFLRAFVGGKSSSSQLLITTHETFILRQDLVRRDEVWIVERDKHLSSHLASLQDFRLRADRDISKAYLSGRVGGIPMLVNPHYMEIADATR